MGIKFDGTYVKDGKNLKTWRYLGNIKSGDIIREKDSSIGKTA